jgi:hypothetical protein
VTVLGNSKSFEWADILQVHKQKKKDRTAMVCVGRGAPAAGRKTASDGEMSGCVRTRRSDGCLQRSYTVACLEYDGQSLAMDTVPPYCALARLSSLG